MRGSASSCLLADYKHGPILGQPAREPRRQGPTTVLPSQKTTEFIKSIDTKRVVGLRDRALIGVMIYALARISAVMGLTVEDFLPLQNAG
jgi:site-specific recombinase XerD